MKRSLRKELGAGSANSIDPKGGCPCNKSNVGRTPESFGHSTDNGINRDLSEVIGMYSGKSESELMRELVTLTARQKAEGSFDPGSVQKGVEAIMPMLDSAQRQKLNEILRTL